MMNRYMLGLFVAVIFANGAVASIYRWNPTKRPAVSLEDALRRANELLGSDAANRYCVSVGLYGNKENDGKRGGWDLYFASGDGSLKHVSIEMNGDSDVTYRPPIDWKKNEGRRAGLTDVRERLATLLAKEGIDASFESYEGQLSVRFHTQVFKVHPKLDSGEYGESLKDVVGPKTDGFVINLFESEERDDDWDSYVFGFYGNMDRSQYLLADENRYLNVEFRYGDKLRSSPFNRNQLVAQIYQVFGERIAMW